MKINGRNKGFTLVELIVVLVILAILAAILVPALLGYIDRSRTAQDMINARNVMQAVQGELVKLYGKGSYNDLRSAMEASNYKFGDTGVNKADIDCDDRELAKEIFELADDSPYAFVFGVHKYGDGKYETKDPHRAFTIYFAAYCATKDSIPIYYDGVEWVTDYPWTTRGNNKGNNVFELANGEDASLQMVILSAPENKNGDSVWQFLQKKHK